MTGEIKIIQRHKVKLDEKLRKGDVKIKSEVETHTNDKNESRKKWKTEKKINAGRCDI